MRVAGLCIVFCLAALTVGCKVATPGVLESRVITRAKHWVFVHDKRTRNPIPFTQENLEAGKEAFSHYCVACHGLDGQNTGVPFADRMSPPVPSLASADVQTYTDGQLKWIIDYGIAPAGMPASRGMLSDEEIWSIVIFIRHLPRAGSLGEPAMYNGDAKDCSPSSKDKPDSRAAGDSK